MISLGARLCLLTALTHAQQQLVLEHQAPFSATQHYPFEPLAHLPGISPYFDSRGFGLPDAPPVGCRVVAASYLVRHSAIYANDNDYESFMEPFLEKLDHAARENLTGPLAVLRQWKSPIDDPENQLEMITPGGIQSAIDVAKHLLKRYPDLVPTTKRIYTDKKPRTQETAQAFIEAFPQKDEIELVTISKHDEAFHAIIPHKSCPAFTKAAGDREFDAYVNHYTKATISRLQPHAPFDLQASDIIGMQQFCGYESAITGHGSELCDIFTPVEWMQYEYAWDIKYSFMVGPGNELSPYLGFPWLNITGALFSKLHQEHQRASIPDDDGQRFFLSVTHREVPPFLATALGLFNSSSNASEELPLDRVNFERAWKMSELIPFLGHVGIEKLQCDATSGAQKGKDYIRFMANSAPRPLPGCQDGPGASCEFHHYLDIVQEGLEKYGDFGKACGIRKIQQPIIWQ